MAQHSGAYPYLGQPCYQVDMPVVGERGSLARREARCDGNRAVCPARNRDISWNSATEEESVVDDVVQRRALLRVGCEYLLYELMRVERDLPVRWELVLIVTDAPTNAHLRLERANEFARKLTDTLP